MECLPQLYNALAQAMVDAIVENDPGGFTIIDDDEFKVDAPLDPGAGKTSRASTVRALLPDLHWSGEGRWRLTFTGAWERREHINILETRLLAAAARHLARSKKNRRRKHLMFTDSAVCLGALGKGRSASPTLLRLCRRWSLFRIAVGVRIFLRHAPTDSNFADGPPRPHVGEHEPRPAPKPKRRSVQAGSARNALQAYSGQGRRARRAG